LDAVQRLTRLDIKLAIVAANNHYAGFGPVNIFRNMIGPEAKWEEKEMEIQKKTSNIPLMNRNNVHFPNSRAKVLDEEYHQFLLLIRFG